MKFSIPSPPLFWRTFLLVILLLVASVLAWAQSFRAFEREPRARQIAQQVVSIVNITRSALLYSDPNVRRELLSDLADNEGVRVLALEPTDNVRPLRDIPLVRLTTEKIIERLGPETRVAAAVNGIPGIWVSFNIDEDAYWVYIERDPLARNAGTNWIRWALVAMLLSIVVAIAITRVVNQPLKRLTLAARELGSGKTPTPLPEAGPPEIRAVNQSFNRMVGDLAKLEQDRAVLLAGISHDLRTPLTRLRLELEMNKLPEETHAAMVGDIEQMDNIVRQFLDYARGEPQQPKEDIDLSQLLRDTLGRQRLPEAQIDAEIAADVHMQGHRTELARALDNLLTNAGRYGRSDDGMLRLKLELKTEAAGIVLRVSDQGAGIAQDSVDRLLRPFERGETARSGTAGAGLGLAIVSRILAAHQGKLRIAGNTPRGCVVELQFPVASRSTV